MKILIINPNTTESMTESDAEVGARHARRDTVVHAVNPPFGPRSIENSMEECIAAYATLETVAKYRDDYDAFVIACSSDPGLSACREITDKPVIGVGEAALHLAALVAWKFSIVTVIPRVIPMLQEMVHRSGLKDRCASIRSTSLSVLEIEEQPERALRELIAESLRAIEEDGAEAICLGCAGMGPLDEAIRKAVPVPVIDGVTAAVKLAESLHDYGLRTSKVGAYAWPEQKEMVGAPVQYARTA
ncbi:MAG: aspartate/glutamate racemase family protein [Gammaproteobacteria bacterium]